MSAITTQTMESLLLKGDLRGLSPEQRMVYYKSTCERVGLDPLARPFDYLDLKGKLVLYANKGCAEQLRAVHKVSLSEPKTQVLDGIFVASVVATLPCGRTDGDIGSVPIDNLKGEMRSNAMLKAVTKAKRRATLSIIGLGMLDETEVDSIEGVQRVEHKEVERFISSGQGEVLVRTEDDNVEPANYPRDATKHDKLEPETPLKMRDACFIEHVAHKERDGKEWWSIRLRRWDEDEQDAKWYTTFSSTIAADASDAKRLMRLVQPLIETRSNSQGKQFQNVTELIVIMDDIPEHIRKRA